MNIVKAENLACPIDGVRLIRQEKQLVCENGHVFDVSRQGYVNLLPVQQKRTRHPGDSKEMVAARSRFLNSGIYEPIAHMLSEIVYMQLADSADSCFMDAGCGEGFYIDSILNYLMDKDVSCNLSCIGLDISKAAIAASAKRNKKITWIVGTNRQPPLDHNSVDIIICVFGFQSFNGFGKILKSGGKVVLVEPGPDHLKELREIIYTEVRKSDPQDLSYAEKTGFSIVDSHQLQFKTAKIDNQTINDLLIMTPHFFRATKQGREAASKLQQLELTVDINFRTLVKNQ